MKENLHTLAWRLHHDLSCEIFDKETEIVIENCRIVSDLKAILTRDFARAITGTIASVSDDDLTKLFREFISLLETHFVKPFANSFDASKLDSKKLIQRLLRKDMSSNFLSCCIIVHCISVACVKVSVESVFESIVSRYEKHFDSARQPTKDHALNEMIIAENGPLIHHADIILERAM